MKVLILLVVVTYATAFVAHPMKTDENLDNTLTELLKDGSNNRHYRSGISDARKDLEEKVREKLENMLEKAKDALERRKDVMKDFYKDFYKMMQKMKDWNIDMGTRARNLLQNIKKEAIEFIHTLLNKLNDEEISDSDLKIEELNGVERISDAKKDFEEKVREKLEKMLEKAKDALERRKDEMKKVYKEFLNMKQKMKDWNIDMGTRARNLLQKIVKEAKEFLHTLLNKLNDEEISDLDFEIEKLNGVESDDLSEAYEKLLENIISALKEGKVIGDDTIRKLKTLREKIKNLKINVSDKAKKIFEDLKEKIKDLFRNLLDKLGKSEKRSLARRNMGFLEFIRIIKNGIKDKMEKEAVKDLIEKYFFKGSLLAKELLKLFKEKGEQWKLKLLDFIDRILGEEEDGTLRKRRSIEDLVKEIQDFMKKTFPIDLEEKHAELGKWIKRNIDASNNKMDNINNVAKKLI